MLGPGDHQVELTAVGRGAAPSRDVPRGPGSLDEAERPVSPAKVRDSGRVGLAPGRPRAVTATGASALSPAPHGSLDRARHDRIDSSGVQAKASGRARCHTAVRWSAAVRVDPAEVRSTAARPAEYRSVPDARRST